MLAGRRIVRRPWFQLFELACVFIASLIWCFQTQALWWPLLVALLPGLIRVGCGVYPFHHTRFDLALLVFLVMAGVGVWAAYDRHSAWLKFWVIFAAILGFQALARQPVENFWILTGLLGLLGAGVAVSFLLIHDWGSQPADFDLLNRIGRWIMAARPELAASRWFHPNQAGGILAILLPYSLAFGVIAWQGRRAVTPKARVVLVPGVYALSMTGLISLGLLMTSSRGAWLATTAAFGIWLVWRIGEQFARRAGRFPAVGFTLALLLMVALMISLVFAYPGEILKWIDQLPGEASGVSRLELANNTLHLIGDFPLSGGGLDAFAGLYSHYMMVIPNFLFSYSHNFYLDVALEQGLIGLSALLFVLLGSVYLLVRSPDEAATSVTSYWLKQAVLISLLILFIHGMIDDALYGNRGTPLLYLPVGLAAAISRPARQDLRAHGPLHFTMTKTWNRIGLICLLVLVILVATLGLSSHQARAIWMANLGALRMAQTQLQNFPSDEWEDGKYTDGLKATEQDFKTSLLLDSLNGTANHRLGLIALLRRDFPGAKMYLQAALEERKGHRGIIKNLGYNHVWLGEYDQAAGLLEHIPEAAQELEAYAWWWKAQGREDLSRHALSMKLQLEQIRGVH